ncbi:MAG: formylmethanofuran dehydrogenase [Deltaproteobacteria bacterium RIFOXYD12_FULL_50_9]|nr:MAG: formylmethanofuran dehydrogenase [Deltaproteobacteria bacterium RIFOXYD12_FULL_50_9]
MAINNFKILSRVVFVCTMSLAGLWNSAFAVVADNIPSSAMYSQLEAFHGHVCAGSIFGARLGLAAKEALKTAGGTGKFSAQYYELSCPVDGIQVAAGTTYGNKALTVQERGEHRLVLAAEENKLAVEAKLTKRAEELGLKSRDLRKMAKALPANAPERSQLEREVEEIHSWLKGAPTDEVVIVTAVNMKVKAISSAR